MTDRGKLPTTYKRGICPQRPFIAMPSKHVRFSRTTTVHSLPSPSPAFSVSTLPSSAGPLTPPSAPTMLPGPTPYTISLPAGPAPKYLGSMRPHALLALPPSINYDVGNHPSTASVQHLPLSMRSLSEPATRPPLPSLTIVMSRLPWSVYVTPSHGTFVSVSDVLSAIYRTLRVQITQSEFHSLPSPTDARRVSQTYEQRYKRLRGTVAYAEEKRGGVRRIDFLMGCTRFIGLSMTRQGPDVWCLNVS